MLAGRTIHIGQSYCALAQKLKLRISWRCNWYIGSHVLFRACAHGQDGGIHFKGDTSLQYQQCHPHCFVRESQKQQKWHHWSGKSGASFQRAWIIPVGILAGVLVGHTCNDDSKVECAAAMAARPLCSKQAERVPADIDVEQKGDDGVGRTCSDMVMMQQRSIRRAIAQARDLCQRLKDESGSPGLVVAVSVDGEEIWSEGLGFADVENRLPCKPDTVMRIASISKPITMAAVGKLVELGKLDLDKDVTEYTKSWPDKHHNGEKVKITTRQLLSHTSGIRHYDKNCGKKEKTKEKKEEDPAGAVGGKKMAKDDTEFQEFYLKKSFPNVDASLELFKDDPLCSRPGTEFLYSSHAWTLVSAVVEGASGQKFPDVCRNLFYDLGLEHTYLDEPEPLIYNRARHYMKNKRGRLVNIPYVDNSYKWAGGGLVSTVQDLNKFGNTMLYAYQNDGSDSTPGYLKASTVKMMWTPVANTKCSWDACGGYGLGWAVIPESQKHGQCRHQQCYVSHTGGAVGASSVLLIVPLEEKDGSKVKAPHGVVVSIIANMTSVGLNKTALEIAQIFQRVETPVV